MLKRSEEQCCTVRAVIEAFDFDNAGLFFPELQRLHFWWVFSFVVYVVHEEMR